MQHAGMKISRTDARMGEFECKPHLQTENVCLVGNAMRGPSVGSCGHVHPPEHQVRCVLANQELQCVWSVSVAPPNAV